MKNSSPEVMVSEEEERRGVNNLLCWISFQSGLACQCALSATVVCKSLGLCAIK